MTDLVYLFYKQSPFLLFYNKIIYFIIDFKYFILKAFYRYVYEGMAWRK